jgi:DNA-binding NtrC family response regulator
MASDSTATSPRGVKTGGGVYRLVALYPPASARAGQSKVLERELLLSREVADGADAQAVRFVLDDPEVSRRHATLRPSDDGGWQLQDAGSHNGTYVNGAKIESVRLCAGDVLRVGQHLLLFQQLDWAASQRLVRRRLAGSSLIGDGPACKWIDEQIVACDEQSSPVLILGESGTGKELVARQLHERSGRSGSFVAVNCTTLTETMADGELFGHAQGAFSGAVRSRDGLFVEARGGTLLLDELGDMPLSVQGKLLRALETGEVRRVGSDRAQHVDVRVVAATHVDLEAAIAAGRFRGDLWARLQRLVIRVPPLRERRDDILLLVRHYLQAAGSRLSIAADAAEALLVHDWPYNVRELRNVVEGAMRPVRGDRAIEIEHLPAALGQRLAERMLEPAAALPLGRAPESREELERILRQHDWNVTKVATLLGRDRKQIYRWCETLGIDLDLEKRR